jgi:hypothetical protein
MSGPARRHEAGVGVEADPPCFARTGFRARLISPEAPRLASLPPPARPGACLNRKKMYLRNITLCKIVSSLNGG